MTRKELQNHLASKGLESSLLDETCLNAASELASSANNDGLEGQINFLIDTCDWTTEDILTSMNEYL
jgi:hypothetical protein